MILPKKERENHNLQLILHKKQQKQTKGEMK